MSDSAARPAEVIPMLPDPAEKEHSSTLVKGERLRVVRLVLEEGECQKPHVPNGDVLFLCPAGEVALKVDNETHPLAASEMVYLKAGQPHSLEAKRTSTVLIVEVRGDTEDAERPELVAAIEDPADDADKDLVQEAAEESFPASDPPGFNPGT